MLSGRWFWRLVVGFGWYLCIVRVMGKLSGLSKGGKYWFIGFCF